jgi:hypothetical protein
MPNRGAGFGKNSSSSFPRPGTKFFQAPLSIAIDCFDSVAGARSYTEGYIHGISFSGSGSSRQVDDAIDNRLDRIRGCRACSGFNAAEKDFSKCVLPVSCPNWRQLRKLFHRESYFEHCNFRRWKKSQFSLSGLSDSGFGDSMPRKGDFADPLDAGLLQLLVVQLHGVEPDRRAEAEKDRLPLIDLDA